MMNVLNARKISCMGHLNVKRACVIDAKIEKLTTQTSVQNGIIFIVTKVPQKTHKLKGHASIHHWTLLRRLPYKKKEASLRRLQWRVRCVCGNEEDLPEHYMLREQPKKHCGCMNKSLQTHFKQEHTIWTMMNYRCQNPNHVAYKHYGGRGIHVCVEWHKDNPNGFKNFLDFMGARPSPGHSIDRVDNDGSYYPYQEDGVTRQVRWATSKEQRANQGRKQ